MDHFSAQACHAVAPEIDAPAKRYEAAVSSSRLLLDKSLGAARAPYLPALSVAEAKASGTGKPDELKAILDEKQALAAGRALDAIPSPLLPRSMNAARSAYLRDVAKAERDEAARIENAKGLYLRDLAFIETKARSARNETLLQGVANEKAKLVEGSVTVSGSTPPAARGRNLIENGNFAERNPDGTPGAWNHENRGKGAVISESGISFLRFISADQKEAFFLQNVQRPENVRELAVSIRVRCDQIKEGGYGLVIAQRDGSKKLTSRDKVCYSTTPVRQWRQLKGQVKLKPETKDLVVKIQIDSAGATVDFADLKIEPL